MPQRFSTPSDPAGLPYLTIADFSEGDFFKAQEFSGFSQWANFDDFQMERDLLALGYESAGVLAPRQLVPFAAFQGWSRLTGAPLDLDGLDEFAAHWRFRAGRPEAPTRGRFGAPGKPELNAVEIAGAHTVVVREAVYRKWRCEFEARTPFPPPDLDAYAAQVAACCLLSRAPAPRRSAPKMA